MTTRAESLTRRIISVSRPEVWLLWMARWVITTGGGTSRGTMRIGRMTSTSVKLFQQRLFPGIGITAYRLHQCHARVLLLSIARTTSSCRSATELLSIEAALMLLTTTQSGTRCWARLLCRSMRSCCKTMLRKTVTDGALRCSPWFLLLVFLRASSSTTATFRRLTTPLLLLTVCIKAVSALVLTMLMLILAINTLRST